MLLPCFQTGSFTLAHTSQTVQADATLTKVCRQLQRVGRPAAVCRVLSAQCEPALPAASQEHIHESQLMAQQSNWSCFTL